MFEFSPLDKEIKRSTEADSIHPQTSGNAIVCIITQRILLRPTKAEFHKLL